MLTSVNKLLLLQAAVHAKLHLPLLIMSNFIEIFIHRKFGSDAETIQHKHKYKQNTKYNDQVHHIIILQSRLIVVFQDQTMIPCC